MQRFWVCYVEGTNGGVHYRHYSLEAAENEAERLARLPGRQCSMVYILECVEHCKVVLLPIEWDIPE